MTAETDRELRVLGISGSLRAASHNTALLECLPALAPPSLRIERFEGAADIPMYNQDLEGDRVPAAARRLREAVAAADGLIICTPEYNHAVPGTTKNLIDWASRPVATAALTGRCAVVLVASTGRTSGQRALSEVTRILNNLGNFVVPGPEVVLNEAHVMVERGDGGPRTTDTVAEELIRIQLRALEAAIRAGAGRAARAPFDEYRELVRGMAARA